MSTAEITKRMGMPEFRTRVVLGYYLLAVATGTFLFLGHGQPAFVVVAAVIYLAATALLYRLSAAPNGRDRGKEREGA